MLKTISFAAVAALALLLIYVATRPDTFRVERSARIHAQPDKIYGLINDLRSFNTWNPYEKKDPAMKGSYAAAVSGKGAAYGWESTKVGTGRMQIVDTAAPSKVTMTLDFVEPFEAHNIVEFTLLPEADATRVTWAMHGPSPFVSKLMHLFFNVDKMVGADFESGLANLKALAERD